MSDFVAGMFGGAAGVLVGHPFDTVKVRLQTQSAKDVKYKGTLDCFRCILKQESMSGFYKGMSSPMAGLAFINAIVFGVHGNALRFMGDSDSVSSHAFAGAMAGFAQSFVCSPMELSKIRMQLQSQPIAPSGSRHFVQSSPVKSLLNKPVVHGGPVSCLVDTYMKYGLKRGVFKGLSLNIYRDITGFALYFAAYEIITRWMIKRRGNVELNAPELLFAGGMSGMISWLLNYPIDVVKSRFQADGASGNKPQYRSITDCILKSYRQEGAGVFTQGLCSTLLRAFPTNAVTFFTVAMAYRLFALISQYHKTPDYGVNYVYVYAHVMEAGSTLIEPLGYGGDDIDPVRKMLYTY